MEPSRPHILIAEREFLIALEAEYLIKSAFDCRITLIRPEQLDQWDSAMLADIDLCLLDVPLDATQVTARVERLIEARVPLMFTTVADINAEDIQGFEVIPIARKPYEGEALIALVKRRLRRRPQPPETDQN